MQTRTLIVDIKGKRYKFKLLSGDIDINVKMNIDIYMPDMLITGLENKDEIWELFISLPDNDSMRNLLQSLTTEFYQDRKVVFIFNLIDGFKPNSFILKVSRQNVISGYMDKLEEIIRVPVLNLKVKRSMS